MKSKAPLLLMEQMVMLLVFALAAALCLQAFVKSDGLSGGSEERDRAVALCQNAAEAMRHSRGNLEQTAELLGLPSLHEKDVDALFLGCDKDWVCMSMEPELGKDVVRLVEIQPVDSGVDGLGKARIEAFARNEENEGGLRSICAIEVCWQESEAVKAAVTEVEIDDGTAE